MLWCQSVVVMELEVVDNVDNRKLKKLVINGDSGWCRLDVVY